MVIRMNFFKRWHQGLKNLSPTQHLKAQAHGYLGTMFGLTFATIAMLFKGMWYWVIAMFFFIWLQALQYYKTMKQYEEMEVMLKEIELNKTLEAIQ